MEKFKEHDVVNTIIGMGTIVHVYPDSVAYVVEIQNETYTLEQIEILNIMNEELKQGDRVELLSTDDAHGIPIGSQGRVISVSELQGLKIYGMMWDNGRTLNLVEGGDTWKKLPA